MNAAIIVGILQLIIREAPGAVAAIRSLMNKENPTDADFEAAKEQIRVDTYESIVTNSALPKG
jgi:nucleoside diphosphate kinase